MRRPGGGALVGCPSCRVRVIASSTRDTRRASTLGLLLLAAGLLLLVASDRGVARRDVGRWLRRRGASCSRCGGRTASCGVLWRAGFPVTAPSAESEYTTVW